jgi:hypothetical protein
MAPRAACVRAVQPVVPGMTDSVRERFDARSKSAMRRPPRCHSGYKKTTPSRRMRRGARVLRNRGTTLGPVTPTIHDPIRALACHSARWRRCSGAEYLQYSACSRLANEPTGGAIFADVSLTDGIAACPRSSAEFLRGGERLLRDSAPGHVSKDAATPLLASCGARRATGEDLVGIRAGILLRIVPRRGRGRFTPRPSRSADPTDGAARRRR